MITDGGHLGNWQPYQNDLNIQIILIVLIQFTLSNHTIYHLNNLFRSFTAIITAKYSILGLLFMAILENDGDIEIVRNPHFSYPIVPNLEFVS